MRVAVDIQNRSAHKGLVRRARLAELAGRVCAGERLSGDVEISVLLCDDPAIEELNARYRNRPEPTDVLSFGQNGAPVAGPKPLGDIVISLETAARNCGGDRGCMLREIEMLFCHGLLHLLGYDHKTPRQYDRMRRKQSAYLNRPESEAWDFGRKAPAAPPARSVALAGGGRRIGR